MYHIIFRSDTTGCNNKLEWLLCGSQWDCEAGLEDGESGKVGKRTAEASKKEGTKKGTKKKAQKRHRENELRQIVVENWL